MLKKRKHDLTHYVLAALIIILFSLVFHGYFSYDKKSVINTYLAQKLSFPCTIDGKKYIYTPQRAGIYFLSLFNGGKYKSPQDAFKSSRKILQTRPDVAEKEISAERLRPTT